MTNPKPSIDDQFWFDESKKMVENSSQTRNKAASTLQTTIGWLWGIYTASASIGLGLSDASYSLIALIIIVAPSPILIAGYWLAVWAQIPLAVSFDPRSPLQIMRAYRAGIQEKAKRLQLALGVSLLAAFTVSAALVTASVGKTVTKESFDGFYYQGKKQDSVSIRGNFPNKKELVIRVLPKESKERECKIYRSTVSPSGKVAGTIPTAKHSKGCWILIEWPDGQGCM